MKSKFKSILHNRNIHHTRGLGLPQRENPRPGGCAGSGILRECGYTPYACCFLVLRSPFYAVVDVLPTCIGQKHRPVIGLAGFHGEQALYLCFSVSQQRGGDLRGKRLAPFLKKSVILPHDKLAASVSAVVVLFALVDAFPAARTFADNHTLGLKQLLRVLADLGVVCN